MIIIDGNHPVVDAVEHIVHQIFHAGDFNQTPLDPVEQGGIFQGQRRLVRQGFQKEQIPVGIRLA